MILKINADDIGASHSVNESIKMAMAEGALNKVSLMVTSPAFVEACQIIKEGRIEHSLHLNLCEGKPLSDKEDIPLLINDFGNFDIGFASFWLKSLFSKSFRNQISLEVAAQMRKYAYAFPDQDHLSLDSHQYYHLIPAVLNLILSTCDSDDLPFHSIRMAREPFLILKKKLNYSFQTVFSTNILKWIILRFLTLLSRNKLNKNGIHSNKYFCGVLYSGRMTQDVFNKFRKYIEKKTVGDEYSEILFHPGGADKADYAIWGHQKDLLEFYRSPDRFSEYKELKKISENWSDK